MTVFSWILKVNGHDLNLPFGNLCFSQNISGFGEKGISTGVFEFDIFDRSGAFGIGLLDQVPVQLFEANNRCLPSKIYYISGRSVNNEVCSFTAYDIMTRTNTDFDTSSLDVFFDKGETAPCGNVLEAIKNQCGFDSIGSSGTGLEHIRFTSEQVSNRKCSDILQSIAEAMCGVWFANYNGGAVLSCLGEYYDTSLLPIISYEYSKINYQGRQKITKLICVNSETGVKNEFTTNEYGTVIKVESPFLAAGTPLDSLVWKRLENYIYQAWQCKKAIINDIAASSAKIDFSGGSKLFANKARVTVDNTGIYFSGGIEPRDDEQWRYEEYLDREKVGIGKSVGNTMIDKNGRILFRNLNKGGYNLDEQSNGISYFRSDS